MPRIPILAVSAGFGLLFSTAQGFAANVYWIANDSVWSDPANWNTTSVPGLSDNVFLGDLNQADTTRIDTAASVNALTLSEGTPTQINDSLRIQDGRSLTLNGGGMVNDGHIYLDGGSYNTYISLNGTGPGGIPQVIAGHGEIVLSDSANNSITTSNVVIQNGNGFGHTIRGAGQLLNNTGGMINKGTIRAEGTNALVIDPNGLGFVNENGMLSAAADSTLRLQSGVFDQVNNASIVTLAPTAVVDIVSSTINGGSISGTGTVTPVSSILNAMAVQSQVTVQHANGVTNTITNGLTLNGTWNMDAGANVTTLSFNGEQTLNGNGEVVLTDSANNYLTTSNATLTIGNNMTVRGAGQLMNNTGGLINNGTLLAQGNNALVLDVNGLNFAQNGVLRAEGAGGLQIVNSTAQLNNSIDIDSGSALLVTSSTLHDGTLNIGSGVSADMRSSVLNDITLNGVARNDNGITNTISNLTLNGTWNLDAGANVTTLYFNGDQTLNGNGEVVLADSANNHLTTSNATLTIGNNMTVRGAGQLMNNTGGLINNGTLLAQGNNALVLDVNGLNFVQNGVLRAEGVGGLQIVNSTAQLNNSIDIDSGSALLVTSSTLHDGTLNIGSGVSADIRSSTLNNVTVNGIARNDNGITNTINNLTLNGTWNVDAGANVTTLYFNGDQTLNGNGEVVLADSTNNYLTTSNATLTIGNNMTVLGAGQLMNNTGGLINNGTLLAQGNNALVLDVNGLNFAQNGVLRAEGAGGLQIVNSTAQLNNSIDIDSGSALLVTSSTLHDGTLNVGSGVSADIRSSVLNNITLNGVARNDNGITNTINNLTLNGTWNMDAGANVTTLYFNGSQTLNGNGEVVLADSANNHLTTTNTTLTIGNNMAVRGAGQLMNNTGGLVNNGSIVADAATNALVIDTNGLGFQNQGLLSAVGTGGMVVQKGYTQTAGETRVDSSLTIANGVANINGGSLVGTGIVNGDVSLSGNAQVNPGNSPGTLTIDGNYSQSGGATYLVEIAGDSNYDVLDITGTASLGGLLDANLLSSYDPVLGSSFDVLFADSIFGTFDNNTLVADGFTFDISYINDPNHDIVRLTTLSSVPLPAALWLFISGLLVIGLSGLRARRRSC